MKEWKVIVKEKKNCFPKYSRSFPFDHYSRKRPALITATFEKLRLNCDLNFFNERDREHFWDYQLDFSFFMLS